MKYFVIIILILSISCNQAEKIVFHPSKIDSLTTKEQVQAFIQKLDTNYRKYVLKEIQNFHRDYAMDKYSKIIAKALHIDSAYYKADFDRNGYTDLLVIGEDLFSGTSYEPLVLMNFGGDSIQVISMIKQHFYSMVPEIVQDKNHTFLVIHFPDRINRKNEVSEKGHNDTLIYKFGSFIEYNPNPAQHNIELIDFRAGPCDAYCPIFNLYISKNEAIFEAEAYNFKRNETGNHENLKFKTQLKPENYQELVDLLNYIDFENLKDQYAVSVTCQQAAILRITYDDNKQKKIWDYGLSGTYGLKRLYQLLFDLRFNQDWEEVTDDSGK